jgi:hypothetical protein
MLRSAASRNWTRCPARRAFRNAIVGKIGIGILEVDGKPVTRSLFSAILSQSASAYFRVAPMKKSVLVRDLRAMRMHDSITLRLSANKRLLAL